MVSFLCATPYHVLESLYIMTGEFPDTKADLYLLDHFKISDSFIGELKSCDLFRDIFIIHSDYKTKKGNISRLIHAFIPSKLMRKAFKNEEYDNVFFGALDYVDMAHWKKTASKKNKKCRFYLMDDGLGTYINKNTYIPKKYSAIVLKLLNLEKIYNSIDELWCYKPEYRIENLQYTCHAIARNPQAQQRVNQIAEKLWDAGEISLPENAIIYLEQPYNNNDDNVFIEKEKALLNKISQETGRPVCIKFHPRSTNQEYWNNFPFLNVSAPLEAVINREEFKGVTFISTISTAVVSPMIINSEPISGYFIQKILDIPEYRAYENQLSLLIDKISAGGGTASMPQTAELLIEEINKH